MVNNNSKFEVGKITVKHNFSTGDLTYSLDNGVFLEIGSFYRSNHGWAGFSVEQAREIAKALNTIADEVEARKPREKTLPEKLAELPEGAIMEYRTSGAEKRGYNTYHKLGAKFYRESSGDAYNASDFLGMWTKAYVNGKEL